MSRTPRIVALGAVLALGLAGSDCQPKPKLDRPTPLPVAPLPPPVASSPAPEPPPAPPVPTPNSTSEESRPRAILGEKTTEIRDAGAETRPSPTTGAPAPARVVSNQPIRITGNAYVSIVGQTSVLKIKSAVDLFRAENDRYPDDTQEFLDGVIRAHQIALPQLPYYQEYAYDSPTHSLVVIEYPDRKEARERERDGPR